MGIAAPQVGMFQRIAIVDVSSKKNVTHHGMLVLINPQIYSRSGSVKGHEGCLPVPDYTGNVIRAEHIHVHTSDPIGAALDMEYGGYEGGPCSRKLIIWTVD